LAFVEILLQIEREFGVDVGLAGFEIDDFRTVNDIADYVERNSPGPT
jgi:acyl carrier protein